MDAHNLQKKIDVLLRTGNDLDLVRKYLDPYDYIEGMDEYIDETKLEETCLIRVSDAMNQIQGMISFLVDLKEKEEASNDQ